jgi:hypothetical protein
MGGRVRELIRRRPLVSFFVLAYGISWIAWAGAYLGLGMVGVVLGGFGPLVAALIATRIEESTQETADSTTRERPGPVVRMSVRTARRWRTW